MSNWKVLLLLCTCASLMLAVGSVLILRPVMAKWFGADHEHRNELLVILLAGTGVFYGLLLGLTAAASYGNYTDAEQAVSMEATDVGTLNRDALAFPEPIRSRVASAISDYNSFVIDQEWPAQRHRRQVSGGQE